MGKTTLVTTYLAERADSCLWLQLDSSDADPATFVHFLREAAALIHPRRKPSLPLPGADDLRDVPAFMRRVFRRLALSMDRPWVLVLDNAQEIGAASTLHAAIAAVLSELPQGARVSVISREAAPADYARLLANQQLAVVDEHDLRFTDVETQQLVALHGRNWQPAPLRQLTDGWAAAMVLLLAARTDLSPEVTLRSGTARDRLFAFFGVEVMNTLPASDAAMLIRIAFLPSATEPMAAAVSGDSRAGEVLAALVHRSLFTERREGVPATYTFHALFSEFLKARATQTLDAVALRELHLKAAHVLARHGHADAAITQLVEARAWEEALRLLLVHAAAFVAQGRTAKVREWILALPSSVRAVDQAAYWLGYCETASTPAEALHHLEHAYDGFMHSGDVRNAFYAAAAAADAVVFLGKRLDAVEPWMHVLEASTPAYLAQRNADIDLRVLPGLLAAFVHRRTGHPLTAALADLAERMLEDPRFADQRILLGTLAYHLLWTGQLVRLERVVARIDRVCAECDAAAATLVRWQGVGVLIRSLLGRVDEALDLARRALVIANPGPAALRTKAHLAMVLAAIAARDAELARSHLTEVAAIIDVDSATDTTVYEYQRGLLMLLDGDWGGALKLMRSAVDSGRASGWPLREHIALLGHALAATQAGALEEAQRVLQAAFDHPFYAVCRWHHWIGGLIEAHLAQRSGDLPRCLAALARAFAVGREYGYDFGPMPYACGDMMSSLTLLAIRHDVDPAFAHGLIRRHALPAPGGAGEHWPWPIRIQTLGRLSIEREGTQAAAARKESRKPLDLLKLLLALGGEAVPVARLSAVLWPDAEGDAARNSFDNALHRLRKLLGADRHLLLQGGALSLNTATCWTDLKTLEALFVQVDRDIVQAGAENLEEWADRILALYGGEFIAGDEALADVLVTRARLQARVSRHLVALGSRLELLGQHQRAAAIYGRVVEQQPLAEDVVRRLISCLLTLGQRAEAYEAFRRCRQQLSVVLGVRPAPDTEALVASLRNL